MEPGSWACFFKTEASTVAGLVEDSRTLTKLASLSPPPNSHLGFQDKISHTVSPNPRVTF